VVDIAGLVKGAADGAGLGNAFLSHIKATDGVIHCLRAFDDADVIHVEDRVDPVEDIEIITNELRVKDLEFMNNTKAKLDKDRPTAPAAKKEKENEMSTIDKVIECLESGKDVRNNMENWTTNDVMYLNKYGLLTSKPAMYLVNLSRKDFQRKKNKWLVKIHEWIQAHGGGSLIPFCGEVEAELQGVEGEEEKEKWLKENELTTSLPKIIKTAFSMVHLIYFFTAGPDEVKAWCIRKGYKAPQAAGAIHTDFERGFICAEVMSFDDLKSMGSETEVKAKGRYRQEGKGYTVEDGDVIFFKFNVSGAKGKK
jgi:obg-like ATPase 1